MTDRRTMKAGEAVVEVLHEAGVLRAYTVPGESFLEILDAVERHMSDPKFIAQAEECQLTLAPLAVDETTQLVNGRVATLSQYEDLVREAIEKHG